MTTNTTTEQGDLTPPSQRCSGAIFIENKEQIEERERERDQGGRLSARHPLHLSRGLWFLWMKGMNSMPPMKGCSTLGTFTPSGVW